MQVAGLHRADPSATLDKAIQLTLDIVITLACNRNRQNSLFV